MSDLTHIKNNKPAMVDISDKNVSRRRAIAEGFIFLNNETIALIKKNEIKKGNVLITAELAGISAAKKTADLIPLCHNLLLNKVYVTANLEDAGVRVTTEVICDGKTGVEMEALTGTTVALLTIYDMCKAVDKNMKLTDIKLIKKEKDL